MKGKKDEYVFTFSHIVGLWIVHGWYTKILHSVLKLSYNFGQNPSYKWFRSVYMVLESFFLL